MITLWGRNNSTNVKKVLWVMEELELPFEQIQAGLQHGVNNTPEYLGFVRKALSANFTYAKAA